MSRQSDDYVAVAIEDVRLVRFGVDFDFKVVRRFSRRNFRSDFNRLAGGEETVHPCGGNADALLPSAHSESMEFRAVEEFSEDERYLFFDDAGTIVLVLLS